MKAFLNSIGIRTKLFAIGILALLALSYPMTQLWRGESAKIDFKRNVLLGVPAIRADVQLASAIRTHRGRSVGILSGTDEPKTIDGPRSDVLSAFGRLSDTAFIKQHPDLQREIDQIRQNFENLSSSVQNKAISGTDSFARQTDLVRDVFVLGDRVAKDSGILLDSSAVTHYLYDTAFNKLEPLIETLGQYRARGMMILSSNVDNEQNMARTDSLASRADAQGKMVSNSLSLAAQAQAEKGNTDASNRLQALSVSAKADMAAIQSSKAVLQKNRKEDAGAFWQTTTQAIGTLTSVQDQLWQFYIDATNQQITRLETDHLHLSITLIVIVIVLVTCILLITRSVTRPLSAAVASAKRIADGDFEQHAPKPVGSNEMSLLLQGLDDMRAKLSENITRERAISAENLRIRIALDNVSTNLMIADNERNIIYLNKSVEEMLKYREPVFKKEIPSFNAKDLLGTNIDNFHKNPEHQRKLLSTFTTTYRSQIQVGDCHFGLAASPVINADGERLGAVVEWVDRTAEVQAGEEVSALVSAAAEGNFATRIEMEDKEGFFLEIAKGLNQLVSTADKGLNDVARVLSEISKGNLTELIEDDYQGTFGELKRYCNDTAARLSEMLGEIRSSSDTIATAAREIAQGNSDLSSRTEEQASSLEETASSMEELTSTVKQNSDNARQANSLSSQATQVAQDGGQLVEQVVSTMNDINTSAQKIAEIIGVIDSIAFQTNILALNAAVEAARAGDQGRGFAVVASEVRNLAQRSANAAKDIKALISASVEKIENGNQLATQAGETMHDIVTAVKRVSDINAEISAASIEQSKGIENVSTAVNQMDEMTQQNAALVEEAAAAAESQQSQVESLQRLVSRFRLQDAHVISMAAPPAVQKTAAKPAKGTVSRLQTHGVKPTTMDTPQLPEDEDDWEQF